MPSIPGIQVSRKLMEQFLSQVRMNLSAALKEERFVKGVLYPVRRKCGKTQCKCANTDYRHESWYLSFSDQGKTKVVYVTGSDVKELLALTKRYKVFRMSRQKLVELFKNITVQVNRLETMKIIPYPKESYDARKTRSRRKKKGNAG